MRNTSVTSVAVVGAGPYGVSIAAHLRAAGVGFRIFGRPLYRWRAQMPKGMFLKSEGFASNLSAPDGAHTLRRFCASAGIPYADVAKPVRLDVFVQYATWFQRHLVPEVEDILVQRLERKGDWFELELTSGETVRAHQVVVATGLDHAAYIPPEVGRLPADLVSHVSDYHDLGGFRGRDVTVIGGGQSALEAAALLAEQGADVRVLVRAPAVRWNSVPKDGHRSLYQRLRTPSSGLGVGLQLWAYCRAPAMFRYLPRARRRERFKNVLGPAGGWWLKERVVGRLPLFTGHAIVAAESRDGRAVLRVARADGTDFRIDTEHVMAATGYRFAVGRLPFLAEPLKTSIRTVDQAPVLTAHFESSVPGLYFTGVASGLCFGPVMRFLVGADYTARRIRERVATVQRSRDARQTVAVPEVANSTQIQGAD